MTENFGDAGRWEGVYSGVQDWRVQEKATTVILTRLHGTERVCVWFSTEHGEEDDDSDGDEDLDEDFGLDEGEDFDKDEEFDKDEGNDIGDDEYEDEEPFIECYLSFSKPPMGLLLITARATEASFTVRSIAHSRDNQIPMDRTAEMEWKCQSLYFGKVKDLEGNLPQNINNYLQTRGINGQLASFIMKYVEEKEEQEKTKWRQTIESFIGN